jgi:hypothetical protein
VSHGCDRVAAGSWARGCPVLAFLQARVSMLTTRLCPFWTKPACMRSPYPPFARRSKAWVTRLPLSPPSEKRAHLDRRPTGDGSLAPPRQCLVQVSGFQHPKTAYVLLGLEVRPVGDEHLAIGLRPRDLALLAAERPPTKTLTPAATISRLSAEMSRDIASVSTNGS